MRTVLSIAGLFCLLAAGSTVAPSPADAATACRAGVYRAGCVHTAPAYRHGAAGCRYVNGRRVCGAVR